MKTLIFGIVVIGISLVAPAYADCGGGGYEPFINPDLSEVPVKFVFTD